MEEKKKLKQSRWKNLRSKILRRDKYICQYFKRFGKTVEAEHVHHIYPAEIFPEYFYCEWNLISLSAKAHNMMHVRGSHELTEEGIKLMKKVEDKRRAYDAAHIPPMQG